MAGAGTTYLSAALVGVAGSDSLSAAQEVLDRAVPFLPEETIDDWSKNSPWVLYTVWGLARRAIRGRAGGG